jgi:hypothetical protein
LVWRSRFNLAANLDGGLFVHRPIVAIGLLLAVGKLASAQLSDVSTYSNLPLPAPSAPTPASGTPVSIVPPAGPPSQVLVAPPAVSETTVIIPPEPFIAPAPQPICEPPWCESPYKNSAWRIQLDVIPTVSNVSDGAFGAWDDNGGVAIRLGLGYEGCDGIGTRLQFWGLSQQTETLVDDVDLGASTFYWDFYKRFFIDHAELALGGGLAGSHLEYKLANFGVKAERRVEG